MVLLIYRNDQHSTLHGTSHLLEYKNGLKDWRETREHVDILLIEMSHAKDNGARVYVLCGRRQTKLPTSELATVIVQPPKAQVVTSFKTP